MLTALHWALNSPTKYPVYRRGEGTQNAWPPQTNSDTQMHPDHPKLPPSASSLRTELDGAEANLHLWHTSESQALPCDDRIHTPGCDTFHPTAMSAWTVFLDSQVSLGPPASDQWWVPAGRAPASVAQAPLQLCLHLRTWQEALCVTCGTSL